MLDSYYGLEFALQIYWGTAIVSSIIFIIQSVMTLMGGDAMDGVEADFDSLESASGPMQMLSLRSIINFGLGFGWGGISLYYEIPNKWLLLVAATSIGILFVWFFMVMMNRLTRLAEDNTFRLAEAEGKIADVYLQIPGYSEGRGKVTLSVKGSFREISAMTKGEEIPTGSSVRIVKAEGEQLVFVEKLSN